MGSPSRFALVATAVAAVTLAIVVAPTLLTRHDAAAPATTPVPGIVSAAGHIEAIPAGAQAHVHDAAVAIGGMLRDMYTAAFVRTAEATPSPTSTPVQIARLREFVTYDAYAKLTKTPELFDLGSHLSVTDGKVRFAGAINFGPDPKDEPIEALLHVDLVAHATTRAGQIANVHEGGHMHLRRFGDDWRMDGFDLKIKVAPAPTPSPSP